VGGGKHGPIQDRTREHLGTSDKVIMANRRMLLKAIETVQNGGVAPGMADPRWPRRCTGPTRSTASRRPAPGPPGGSERAQAKRDGAPWLASRRRGDGRTATQP
jgi:phthalate 4,5-dioxygenase oxygenase subunit